MLSSSLFDVRACVRACVFVCLVTPFPLVLFAFQGNLLLLNLINRYMTSTSELFLKGKSIMANKFLISTNYPFNKIYIAAEST